MKKIKLSYKQRHGVLFVILFLVEVVIALFINDEFIRPYLGDVLVVWLLYCLIRMLIGQRCSKLPLYIAAFAIGIEFLQYFNFLQRLGLSHVRFLRLILGASFDIQDILCYCVGAALLVIAQRYQNKLNHNHRKN